MNKSNMHDTLRVQSKHEHTNTHTHARHRVFLGDENNIFNWVSNARAGDRITDMPVSNAPIHSRRKKRVNIIESDMHGLLVDMTLT